MDCTRLFWPKSRFVRWLAVGLYAGMPLCGTGCQLFRQASASLPSTSTAAPVNSPKVNPAPTEKVLPVALYRPTQAPVKQPLPAVRLVSDTAKKSSPVTLPDLPSPATAIAEVAINLDTVLRLAEQHNPRIGLARERLHESLLTQSQKTRLWLPNVYAGIGYYRHEGGIQDQDGRLIHSSTGAIYPGLTLQSEIDLREATFQEIESMRRVAQEKVSLSQVNNEVLLDAALTYIDLLTARRGEFIARDLEAYDKKLLDRAEKLTEEDRSANTIVEATRASMANRRQTIAQLRQQGNSASAKLVYLLGLPPHTTLAPIDPVLAPIELVDITPGPDRLISQAIAQGPGTRELEGILGIIQLGLDKSNSVHNLLPSVQVNAFEGAFGAGPGGSLAFDNRLDFQVQLRWNITQLCQSDFQRTVARSKQVQALLSRDDLRGKLAAGVLDATESIYAGREVIGLASSQIRHASENYRLTNRRLEEGIANASPADVLLSIRALEQAHFNHLTGISSHNKAQIRLLLLLGFPCTCATPTSSAGMVPGQASSPTTVPVKPLPGQKAPASADEQLPTPRPLKLPIPTSQGSPVPGGPDGSIIKLNWR